MFIHCSVLRVYPLSAYLPGYLFFCLYVFLSLSSSPTNSLLQTVICQIIFSLDPSLDPSSFGSGGIILQRFRIDSLISDRGHCIVFGGSDLANNTTVAVKIALAPDDEKTPESAQSQLENEVDILLGPLRGCPGVPRVVAHGAVAFQGVEGAAQVLVEAPLGVSLKITQESQDQTMPDLRLLLARWKDELKHILRAVHARGVIHRDIKPSNIIQTEDGSLTIIDFGLAVRTVHAGSVPAAGSEPYVPLSVWENGEAASTGDDFVSLAYTLHSFELGVELYENNYPRTKWLANIEYRGVGAELRRELEAERAEAKTQLLVASFLSSAECQLLPPSCNATAHVRALLAVVKVDDLEDDRTLVCLRDLNSSGRTFSRVDDLIQAMHEHTQARWGPQPSSPLPPLSNAKLGLRQANGDMHSGGNGSSSSRLKRLRVQQGLSIAVVGVAVLWGIWRNAGG
jgi:hypothetical protein